MAFELGKRRGVYIDITTEMGEGPLSAEEKATFESIDLAYRSLCSMLYNYVPMSGHPGGSISSGRFVQALLYSTMDYDMTDPDRKDSDIISYAAGHKAMGLYAAWGLRNEVAKLGSPGLLPEDTKKQLRLEDLLGFRRNPMTATPLFKQFTSKPLDGHPTPGTPFVKLSTGASGVGITTSFGLAFGARDYYGANSPKVHIIEGEGGATPGRVAEAMASAGTSRLDNVVIHLDWNQASIDSNRVCREGDTPGDYVQWDPMELGIFHDFNVIYVPDGFDFQQIIAAQNKAVSLDNGQPTMIVYKTVKGWKYGIEGKGSHGGGHKYCSDPFFEALDPLLEALGEGATCDGMSCDMGAGGEAIESCFWSAMGLVRRFLESKTDVTSTLGKKLAESKERLNGKNRTPREGAPDISKAYEAARGASTVIPDDLKLTPGSATTLRGELGKVLTFHFMGRKGYEKPPIDM